jgi:hypothetical protein
MALGSYVFPAINAMFAVDQSCRTWPSMFLSSLPPDGFPEKLLTFRLSISENIAELGAAWGLKLAQNW